MVDTKELSQYALTIQKMAEDLAELDVVSDAIWNLRGEVFADLKSEGFIPVEDVGSEHQPLVDAVIRRLLELV